MRSPRLCTLILALAWLSVPLWAKGPTTRIVITAPSLPTPVEITDPTTLNDFVVWSGPGVQVNGQEQSRGFVIDWPAGAVRERPASLPQFQVSFYVKHANRPLASQQEQIAYVVTYEPDFTTARGYVYLPGRGDDGYALNTRAIFRGREGHWFYATDAWNRAVMKLIK